MNSTSLPQQQRVAARSAGAPWHGVLSLLTLIGALLASGCTSTAGDAPPPDEGAAPQFTDEYRIGVGDSLTIDVWRNPEVSTSVPVRPDGRISMPLLGDVDVGGQTPEAVARQISEGLADFVRDPQVSVIVTDVGSNEYLSRVRVTGAVRQPVSLPYRPGMTVLDVVLEAGGVTEFASANATRLYRPGRDAIAVRLDAILERGDLSTNHTLRPGDVITVPEGAF